MHLLPKSNKVLRSRWLAPTLHMFLFAITWLTAFAQARSVLEGPARFGFAILFIVDFPISVVASSKMWDGRLVYGLSLWGVLGTVWWYFLGTLNSALSRSKGRLALLRRRETRGTSMISKSQGETEISPDLGRTEA